MKPAVIIHMMFLLLVFAPATSDSEIRGDINIAAKLVDISGSEGRFNKYRDVKDGLYSGIHLMYDSGYFFDLSASDIGYDTQEYVLEGGRRGLFEYYFEYRESPYNITDDARTFYSGTGSPNLKGPPRDDVGSWSEFDYSIERKRYGGGLELRMLKPFYITASVTREERDGIRPAAAEGGIGFGNAVELPEPVDYSTDVLKVEAGYSKKPLFSSLTFMFSSFGNNHEILHFDNPFIEGNPSDALTLPPDNRYYKIAFRNALKLPFNSKFSMNAGYSRTRSEENLLRSFFEDGELETVSLSDHEFDGKIHTENYDFVFTSRPSDFLDFKIFYKYYRRKNDSDEIMEQRESGSLTNELLSYHKNRYGMELGFRLPAAFRLLTSYKRLDIDRNREDVRENKDDVYAVDLRWDGADFISATLGYERLHRSADFQRHEVEADDPEFLETFVGRFDVAPKDSDIYKIAFDVFPLEHFSVTLSYRKKDTDYRDTILGLQRSDSDEFSISADYAFRERVKLAGHFDWEKTTYDQLQRRVPNDATTGFDPDSPPTSEAFNWSASEEDSTYEYGFGADIDIIRKKLTLRLGHSSVRSDGNVDYTFLLGGNPLPSGRTQDNIDLSDWDDYRLTSYLVKLVYSASNKIDLSAGYLYEKFDYDDAQVDDYEYVVGSPATTYLTGAYADQSYRANILFASVTYKF